MNLSDCALCRLVAGEYRTQIHYLGNRFIVVDCETCRVPMAVARDHNAVLDEYMDEMQHKLWELFGNQIVPDTHMRAIPDHLHIHAR